MGNQIVHEETVRWFGGEGCGLGILGKGGGFVLCCIFVVDYLVSGCYHCYSYGYQREYMSPTLTTKFNPPYTLPYNPSTSLLFLALHRRPLLYLLLHFNILPQQHDNKTGLRVTSGSMFIIELYPGWLGA